VSWLNPPPVVVLGGTENFLSSRELRKACLAASMSGRDVVHASTGVAAFGSVAHASMFGMSSLVVVPAKEVSKEQVQGHLDAGKGPVSVVLLVDGALDEKRFPAITPVHGSARIAFDRPEKLAAQKRGAQRFARSEASRLGVGLSDKLSEALVGVVGADLGRVSFEVLKAATLTSSGGRTEITPDDVRSTLHQPASVDMKGVARALRMRDTSRLLLELDRFSSRITGNPEMLLLRGRGGPADLAMKWVRIASLQESGADTREISKRVGIPSWAMQEEERAARRWGLGDLRGLVRGLARVETATLKGAPSSWVCLCSTLAKASTGSR
jgi:DNA polymerase III delta subunit